jgi:hypothetical protein
MRKPAVFVALLSYFLVGFARPVEAAPNFSGDWKMNIAKSDFGPVPAPGVLTRAIKHNDPALEIATHQKGARGEVNTQLKYTTDGKPCMNTVQGGEAKGTATWHGDSLVIESERDFQGTPITSKETWTLSDGGKTLTIANHVSVPQQGEFDIKYVFDKQ